MPEPRAKANREQKLRAQAAARATMTAVLNGVMLRDKMSVDLGHQELREAASEGLLMVTSLCQAVEFGTFVQRLAELYDFDVQDLWAEWCTKVQLPESDG